MTGLSFRNDGWVLFFNNQNLAGFVYAVGHYADKVHAAGYRLAVTVASVPGVVMFALRCGAALQIVYDVSVQGHYKNSKICFFWQVYAYYNLFAFI